MKCDAIIYITVLGASGNDELVASRAAMLKKYGGRQAWFDISIPKGELSVLTSWMRDLTENHPLLLDEKARIGLYWAVHGANNGTDPPADTLGGLTAEFYLTGMRFSKINLSACFSAGKDTLKDLSQSALSSFCKKLSDDLAYSNVRDKLAGVMVAGYRAVIVLLDTSEKPDYSELKDVDSQLVTGFFMGKRKNPELSFDKRLQPGHIQNTFEEPRLGKAKSYIPTRPHLSNEQFGTLRGAMAGIVDEANRQKSQKKSEQVANVWIGNLGKTPDVQQHFQMLELYIRRKIILEYDNVNHTWKLGSLNRYSDHATIQELAQIYESIPGKKAALTI